MLFRRLFASISRPIPPLNETIKDVPTFLGRIKRNCEQYAGKIGTWDNLFQWDGKAFTKAGIPIKARRWILSWTEKYRQCIDPYYIRPSQKAKRPRKTTRKAFKHL